VEDQNVILFSDGNTNAVRKDVSGNTWNASAYSQETAGKDGLDFAFSWEVEAIAGTIREMVGINQSAQDSASYQHIDYAIYQVNKNVYAYEGGKSMGINLLSSSLAIGDRLGIQVTSRGVEYFVQRLSGEFEVFYKSTVPFVIGDYSFDTSLNRGDGSSGNSKVTNIKIHTLQKTESFVSTVEGFYNETVSEDIVSKSGIEILESTYGDFKFRKSTSSKFDYPLDIQILYTSEQNIKNFTI
jgi:hypothetical protein